MNQPEYVEIEEIGCKINILEEDINKLVNDCNELQSFIGTQLKTEKCIKCEEQATKYVDCGRTVNPPIYIYVCDEYPLCKCKQLNTIKK